MSANNLITLKSEILTIINGNKWDINKFNEFLGPVKIYIDSPTFILNLQKVIDIILEDRDGNNKFTIDDLKLLQNDILGITSLVNNVLLVIGSIPELKLKYEINNTEQTVFKVFAYIFLIAIPDQTGKSWSAEEKETIVDLTLAIYSILSASQVMKDLVKKISNWFKKKGLCQCISITKNKQDIVNQRMPKLNAELRTVVQRNKDLRSLKDEVNMLRGKLDSLMES